jgi:hypothetical protein
MNVGVIVVFVIRENISRFYLGDLNKQKLTRQLMLL